MGHFIRASLFAACLGLCIGAALAQSDTTSYVFGEYYVCDQNRESFADAVVERFMAPVYDKHVKQGNLTDWGLLAHNAGGRWRRLLYYESNSLETLLETRDKMIEEFQGGLADAEREFTSICPEHDDLIWEFSAGGASAQPWERPASADYATYYICDFARQERADEIVKQLLAPEINKLVASGVIANWGWYSHVIGGRYRRLMTHRGADHASLLAAVVKYNDAATEADEALVNEFNQICASHVDYLWDVVPPKSDKRDEN